MIYVLEDDMNIRKMLSFALGREGYQVKEFSNSRIMYESLLNETPELLLLDIMLPGEDGFHVLGKLRKNPKTKNLPIIILTAKSNEIDKLQGLDGGADDYVTKPFGVAELMARIRAVLRRSRGGEEQNLFTIADLTVDDDRHKVFVSDQEITLSKKEYALLLILLRAKGKVCTREALLSGVWGVNYGESRTLDVHIRKLRQKLLSEGERIETIKGVGYRIKEDGYET